MIKHVKMTTRQEKERSALVDSTAVDGEKSMEARDDNVHTP